MIFFSNKGNGNNYITNNHSNNSFKIAIITGLFLVIAAIIRTDSFDKWWNAPAQDLIEINDFKYKLKNEINHTNDELIILQLENILLLLKDVDASNSEERLKFAHQEYKKVHQKDTNKIK